MRSRNTRFFRIIASLVAASFAWLTGGGQAWAEVRAVEKSPARALARLADDPRLALSAAERDYLRAAADYLAEAGEVARNLDAAADSRIGPRARLAAQAAARRLHKSGDERPHQRLDPAHLPFAAATPTRRRPGSIPGGRGAGTGADPAAAVVAAAADLDPTEDAPITADIQNLAASLGNQPLPIFNWVR